ncbi:hypothetical protein TH4_08375 [Thalassospira tepidiphila MCCC 1A03514]|uniref:Uncharacterized protein n=1 Tax=Thalassospira tepidiphila MCCC 1A03514 TaxID=1177930 RepID=A0A853L0Z0_9PROT|nr:hypothetical protein TH4_08375 [Thalassospira tepidiphila MCCC 1A03514]
MEESLITKMLDTFDLKALISVGAGALVTHMLHSWKSERAEKVTEVRCINAAVITAKNICEFSINLKKESFGPFYTKYSQQHEEIDKAFSRYYSKPGNVEITAHVNLLKINKLDPPIFYLRSLVYEHMSASPETISLVNFLADALETLNSSIDYLNDLALELSKIDKSNHQMAIEKYFGRVSNDGHSDTRYPDTIDQVLRALDATIFFSMKVCDELAKSSQNIVNSIYVRKPTAISVSFANEKREGLVPSDSEFPAWETK